MTGIWTIRYTDTRYIRPYVMACKICKVRPSSKWCLFPYNMVLPRGSSRSVFCCWEWSRELCWRWSNLPRHWPAWPGWSRPWPALLLLYWRSTQRSAEETGLPLSQLSRWGEWSGAWPTKAGRSDWKRPRSRSQQQPEGQQLTSEPQPRRRPQQPGWSLWFGVPDDPANKKRKSLMKNMLLDF